MSLRTRVLAGFVAIALLLVVTDIVIAVTVQRSLVSQVDRRLSQYADPLTRFATRPFPPRGSGSGSAPGGAGLNGTPSGNPVPQTTSPSSGSSGSSSSTGNEALTEFYLAILGPDGQVQDQPSDQLRPSDAPPALDPDQVVARATEAGQPISPFTVDAQGGNGLRYRVAVIRDAAGDRYVVVGTPLREADATFRQLVLVEAGATALVLLVLGLIAFWVVRLGIRPIDEMAATANAIAEGDLSRRVEVDAPQTEAGRLGVALNGMLHQIEGAFAERQASEAQLRRFVADASHELRTPLTSIRGYTELYRSGAIAAGAPLDDAMRRIEGESARMGVLVDDLLLLARLDQGRPLEARPVDLRVLAFDAVADARAVEPDRPIGIDVPDEPTVVVGDEARLRQVIGNLLANARQHTPPGSAVDVKVAAQAGEAIFEVADTGPGLAPEEASHVFERFYRVDESRTRANGAEGNPSGAGLGLSIVAAVAAAHHGRAVVETSPGHGARFRIELPLAPVPA